MRMRFVPSAVFLVASLCTAFAANVGAQTPPPKKEAELVATYKRLNGQEMRTLIVGNTGYMLFLATTGTINKGTLVTMYWRDDARTRVGVGNDKKKVESIWWIEGDLMCGEQKNSDRKGNFCNTIYGLDSAYYICAHPAGNCDVLMRMAPGNPDKL